ncbi:protein disulfide-isomerase [Hepatocystis sp. ex Piliocolobus tephrosceles]|uniref:Protein disulfide-isomerase 2-like n=1 Tax=Piliocolobus tephrosceles TaxID=591936 RepID=A0A8C9H0M3_9PRIM|nr:protein disulfide-isomerase [Hepatocystis sp. ex Piliocolobus tephrosceles]
MTYGKIILVLYFLIQLYSCYEITESPSEVPSIDMTDFNKILINNQGFTILMLYAHWCSLSLLLLKNLKNISSLLTYDGSGIANIVKMNVLSNRGVIEKLNIYSYPALFMIKKNIIYRYNGFNKMMDILLWVYKHLDTSVFEINNKTKLTTFLQLEEYNNAILFFISKKGPNDKLFKQLVEISISTQLAFFLYITQKDIIDFFENDILSHQYKFNLEEVNDKDIYGILFKKDDFDSYFFLIEKELEYIYDMNVSKELKFFDLSNWIQKKIKPLVIKFSEYYFPVLFSNETITLFILYNNINQLNKTAIIKSAMKHKHINFAVSGAKETFEKRLLSELLIENFDKPIMRITEFKTNVNIPYKYKPLDDNIEINENNIDQFLNNYKTEKKYLYRKSERALDDEYNDGYVKILVADTYEEYIFNNEKDVLVLYYALWCGHCYKFEPIYREIGKRFKLYASKFKNFNNDIIIGKIDATNNDIYDIYIDGFPTIYLFTKINKKEPIKYVGERTLQNIVTWLRDQTHTNIDIEEFLNLSLDDEQIFENYEEL